MPDWKHCTGCGACCISAGRDGFMPAREDGACIHLTQEGLCEIYDERPTICRVLSMNPRARDREIADACNSLMQKHGIDRKYFVILP